MIKYLIRRVLQSIPTMLGITVLSYLLMILAPGGPARALTFGPNTRPEQVKMVEAALGVNDPWHIQYLRWLLGDDWMRWDSDGDGIADHSFILPLDADGDGVPEPPGKRYGIIRGDFGTSFFQRRPVINVLGDRIGATLELGISSLIVSLTIGVPIGIWAAVQHGKWFDNLTRILAVIVSAIPTFWLGFMLLLIFGQWLRILPLGDRGPTTLGPLPPIWERLQYMILPVFVLASGGIAGFSRYMRASMLDVINQDYIRTARSKGLSTRQVWFRHGARNAMIPLATFLGPSITGVIGGAAITESVFNWNGLGRTGVAAVTSQDYPVVMAVVIIGAVATIIGYLISDVLYAIIDPRIRFT